VQTENRLPIAGTPVIYDGDEIGMGDNVYLGDRDGVRTPMQWTSDRNGGFLTANQHRLYLPMITEQQFPFESVTSSPRLRPSRRCWRGCAS
jgi:maltose alpha-D-glucosyltransferase/alpha-amylase